MCQLRTALRKPTATATGNASCRSASPSPSSGGRVPASADEASTLSRNTSTADLRSLELLESRRQDSFSSISSFASSTAAASASAREQNACYRERLACRSRGSLLGAPVLRTETTFASHVSPTVQAVGPIVGSHGGAFAWEELSSELGASAEEPSDADDGLTSWLADLDASLPGCSPAPSIPALSAIPSPEPTAAPRPTPAPAPVVPASASPVAPFGAGGTCFGGDDLDASERLLSRVLLPPPMPAGMGPRPLALVPSLPPGSLAPPKLPPALSVRAFPLPSIEDANAPLEPLPEPLSADGLGSSAATASYGNDSADGAGRRIKISAASLRTFRRLKTAARASLGSLDETDATAVVGAAASILSAVPDMVPYGAALSAAANVGAFFRAAAGKVQAVMAAEEAQYDECVANWGDTAPGGGTDEEPDTKKQSLTCKVTRVLADALTRDHPCASARPTLHRRLRALAAGGTLAWTAASLASACVALAGADFSLDLLSSGHTLLDVACNMPDLVGVPVEIEHLSLALGLASHVGGSGAGRNGA
ncbi:hypothetical protein HYH03_006926 [Edaphochlamys debaryana]|uniref:Uncharacterized protein n=1 Tax=Edaphochlamys debaryana TaxID=47281 RepID=A0A835Y5A5_9CHLO|nr:hypothetical protein HYH03_006926 [Edaphochlamys debaryana]|eukprot:KAG2494993.1 hypothetical protein HYH03_006926 [Edaphochlamys debaryana]